MKAYDQSRLLAKDLSHRFNRLIMPDEAHILRRAELALHRWHELECGNGNQHGSWAIERDDNGDGPPFMVQHHYWHDNGKDTITKTRIPDREAGAIRRVKAVCDRLSLYYYVQSDPRGAALYVSDGPIDGQNYTDGVCCAVR